QIFAAIGGASAGNCYRIEWIRPDATIAETHDLPGSSGGGGNPRLDSFTVPASGPSGVWSARQYKGGATSGGACAGVATLTLQHTLAIDVARPVLAGATATGGVEGVS